MNIKMKKILMAAVLVLAAVQMRAGDAIKVFNNQMFNAPIISVINTNSHYDYLVVKEANRNSELMRMKIDDKVDLHEKMPYAKNGEYTIELIKGDEIISENVEVVNNRVILNEVEVDHQGFDNIKFFVLDDNKTLLTSYHTQFETELAYSIKEAGSTEYVKPKLLGETKVLTSKKSIAKLEEGKTYVATLYAGDTAYKYEFTR